MCTIKSIKEKRRRSDEDSILEKIMSRGNMEIINKESLKMIFEYATNIGYVNKSHYCNHNTYNINTEIINCEKCSACGENITPFNCDNYNIDLFPKYVDINTFEELAKEVNQLKNTVNDIIINTIEPADNENPLEKKIELL